MNWEWLQRVTPGDVLKWAFVIFAICGMILLLVVVILSMVEGFS